MKRGYDPEDPREFQTALKHYMFNKILTEDLNGDRYFCQIRANLVKGEMEACLADIKVLSRVFLQ